MAASGSAPTRVTVLGGFLGTGKTTLLRRLLATRPPGARWAVLINEFGSVGIDGALVPADGVCVRELAGGCICCSALMAFRAAIVELLRRERPERLIIEPTGLAGLGSVRALLAEPGIAPQVRVDPLLVLLHPAHWANPRMRAFPVYQEQVQAADVVGITHADRVTPEQLARVQAELGHTPQILITHGVLDEAALAAAAAAAPRLRLRPLLDRDEDPPAVSGRGWTWPATARADLPLLLAGLAALPVVQASLRCKGVLRGADGWVEIHIADGQVAVSPRGPHDDARLECLHPDSPPPDWRDLDALLAACISEA